MRTTTSQIKGSVAVNADGQIVWRTGTLQTDVCQHILEPVVLTRAMSLAIARSVIAAQEGQAAGASAKPTSVSLGDVWRCVGIEGELVVREVSGGAPNGEARLSREGQTEPTVRAREADVLGLKEWNFVRAGAR